MKLYRKRVISLLLALMLLVGMMPMTVLASNEIELVCDKASAPILKGKNISILGASISTYAGISNNPDYNSTIGSNAVYYTEGRYGVYANDTWWMQATEDLGLRLLVNNSWSGSSLLYERNGTVGAYVDRCVQLHNNDGEEPDIIAIQMGTNDFQYYKDTLGTADIDYDALINLNDDGSYTYAEPSTSLEAAAIVLHKISVRYPNAEVYYLNISQRVDGTDALIQSFNAELKQVVEHFGAHIVDIYGSVITMDEFDTYIGDGRVHPNKLGMDAYAEAFKRSLISNTEYKIDTHTVSFELDGVTADYGDDKIVVNGDSFAVKLTSNDDMKVTVIMGGKDITADAYASGAVTIDVVTEDVKILAEYIHTPQDYRWEFDGTDLTCVDGNNALTKNAGTTSEGVFTNTKYALEKAVVLQYDKPWVVEWKCEGTFQNAESSSGARIFTSTDVNAEYNARYVFKSNKNGLIAMGEKTTTGSHNYGIALGDYGIDWTEMHTYRLENRIAEDGSNMVHLFVDGCEIGAMNHYYVGTTDKNTTSDWLAGKDFIFPYMGTDTHGFSNASIEYIQIMEVAHSHRYENGKCTGCGAAHPNLANCKGKVISILGDSISTFAGYIPTADGFNLEHLARYPQDNLLTDVNETWWMQVIHELDAKLGINDSWRGATVSGAKPVTTGTNGENASMANLTRIQNLGSNGTPDIILFYGGTNDLAHVSKVGVFNPDTAPDTADLSTTKWDNLVDGYVNTILRLQYFYPDAQIICLLPTYTTTYYSNDKLAQGNEVLAEICEYYGVTYADLRYCGMTTADLPDGIHPGATGMDYITEMVLETLSANCDVEAGENIVYSVNHELNNAESSLGYYKGISHGETFSTMIQGEELAVSVTMGGEDITDAVYVNGVITIPAVTGDLVIKATGKQKLVYTEHLQQLPGSVCSETNLWTLLEHDKEYYTASGWGVHSSGKVRSVTIPIVVGDRIWATSFQASGKNGSTMNGIRLTWFDETGVLESVSADKVYEEFALNGYLIAPEGAVVVNVVMWNGDDSNELYILNRDHVYENGICTGCGIMDASCSWQVVYGDEIAGAYSDLQSAIDDCAVGGTILLTENCAVTEGAIIDKNITIDGANNQINISSCSNAFITVKEDATVTIRNLKLDGGADGFEVDYEAVTYNDYTIPLKKGSLEDDPKASQSSIISSGTLVCENVDISNRYTSSYGGAMQILTGSATLTDCEFTHNYGTSKGGALFIGSNFGSRTVYPVEQVTINNCTFTENYTGHGGAIYAYNTTAIEITDSEFCGNTADGGKGGAINLFSETTSPSTAMKLGLDFMQTNIQNCTFRGNWAGNDGFAIQSYDSDLYIYDSKFIKNVGVHPTSSVGTVSIEAYRHADENWRIYTLMDGCLFEGNEGPCAVYGDHSSNSDLDVINCVFKQNVGSNSFLLYSATSNIENCQFIGETMTTTVMDARIYENYTVLPQMTLNNVTFTDCDAPTEILTRKQNHNEELNAYTVLLQGTTNGDITIWDNNSVSIQGRHTGNVQLGYGTERNSLMIGTDATVNGIIFIQPTDSEAKLGENYMVEVLAEGKGFKYQWYFRNAGSDKWYKSGVKDNTYDDVMTTARAGREIYCIITDANGNSVTTDTVMLIAIPSEKLEIVTQPTNGEAVLGERYCVTVEANGEGLKYQWYFRNKGATNWTKSSVRDNTYDDVMTTARADREVYCVITDAFGNKITTDIVKLVRVPMKLEIITQPVDVAAPFGEKFCATVEAKGESLKYQWYYRNAGTDTWHKSGVRDNTYDDIMTKARNGREIYCVITDAYGNTVTTDIVKLTAVPSVELKLLGQTYESAAMGERYCLTVNVQGESLSYAWYFRNAGSDKWYKSGVKDNTYDDVMTKARANRDVYCVITDAFGNQVTTEVVTLVVEK